MGFLLDGLDPESYDRAYTDRQLVARILGYFRPQAHKMAVVAATIVLTSLVDTGVPIVISRSLDRLQLDAATANLLMLGALIMLLGASSWLLNALRQWLSVEAVGDVVLKLRDDAFDAVMQRDLSFYDAFPSGKVVSRVNSDTQAFSQVITLTMELMSRLLLIVLLLSYLLYVSARLTLILILLAPLIVIAALSFRALARTTITESRRISANVSAHIQETISGIGVAKTFRREQSIFEQFLDVNMQSFLVTRRTRFVFSSIFGAEHSGRHRHRVAGVFWRADSASRSAERRRVVFVHSRASAVLVSAHQHRLVLEPVPARAGSRRARVCADRRRPEGGADRCDRAGSATRRDSVCWRWV